MLISSVRNIWSYNHHPFRPGGEILSGYSRGRKGTYTYSTSPYMGRRSQDPPPPSPLEKTVESLLGLIDTTAAAPAPLCCVTSGKQQKVEKYRSQKVFTKREKSTVENIKRWIEVGKGKMGWGNIQQKKK